jgi:endogenous inhibitor of DNA gyrase (YacG/DUF329 family)
MSAAPSRARVIGERNVRCPACGGKSRYAPDNPYRPFCSERCRHLDLGAWASESYRVGSSSAADAGDIDETAPPPH